MADFAALQTQAKLWVDTVADVRTHEATHQRPIEHFEVERSHLGPLNPAGFHLARICTVRANKQFRVPLDSNHYLVPAKYAGQRLTLKAYAERVCIYERDQLVARHPRSMDRHQPLAGEDVVAHLAARHRGVAQIVVTRDVLVPQARRHSVKGPSSCTGCCTDAWGSHRGGGGKWGVPLGLSRCEGGKVIKPSACMRSSATRHVMSLISPLGLTQVNNLHSLRDSPARLSLGFYSIKSLMVWISWALNSRAQ